MPDAKRPSNERPHSIGVIGAELRAAMASDGSRRPNRRRAYFRIGLALSATAAACALVLTSVLGGRGGDPFTVESAVAKLAQTAFDQPRLHPNEYLYTRSEQSNVNLHSYLGRKKGQTIKWVTIESQVRENWARDGHTSWGRVMMNRGRYASDADRARAKSFEAAERAAWHRRNPHAPYPDFLSEAATGPIVCKTDADQIAVVARMNSTTIAGGSAADLPDDAAALYAYLLTKTRHFKVRIDRSGWVWDTVVATMQSGALNLKPGQRRAMIGALAEIPNVQTFGSVQDPGGREAIGFSLKSSGQTRRVYFDPATSLVTYSDTVGDAPVVKGSPVKDFTWWKLTDFKYVARPPKLKPTRERSFRVFLACPMSGAGAPASTH